MRKTFKITDYKIQSTAVYMGTLYAFSSIVLSLLVAEIIYDLRSTSLEILIPLTGLSLLNVAFSIKFPSSKILRSSLVLMAFVMVEAHFLYNAKIFHVISYWFPFIPLIALIIQGMRAFQFWVAIVILSLFCNSFILSGTVGNSYEIVVYKTPFLLSGIIFSIGILASSFLLYSLLGSAYGSLLEKNIEIEQARDTIENKKNLLARYQQDLLNLGKDDAIIKADLPSLFKGICKQAAGTLQVSRVSIWLLEEENTRIARQFLFEKKNLSDDLVFLHKKDYPSYFHAIEASPFIMAEAAREHPETKEFTEGYLKPLNIYSMLDCPILVDRKPVGVICCEHQHEVKHWNAEDALFIQSLADFISASYKNARIKNLLTEIRQKNYELTEMNNEVGAINEELTALNDTLEETVRHRTHELETQNTQLTEYAFINSHLLRAPLSRVLGLSYLLEKEVTSAKDSQLLRALMESTNELDQIIRRISDILYDGKNISREDIKEIVDRNLNSIS